MVSARRVINSIKPNLTKPPPGPTQKGSVGYDNIREDIEKVKSLREGSVEKVPVLANDIVNKAYVDSAGAPDVEITVFNNTGSTLSKGAPVYVSGWNAGQSATEVTLADADNASAMPAIGLIKADILTGSTGIVEELGILEDFDTSSFSNGDELYIDTTAGTLTATKPTGGTTAIQKIAQVLRSHASQGVVLVFGAGRSNDIPNVPDREWTMGAHTLGFTQQSATGDGTTTIDWRLGNKFKFTFGAQNDTFTFTAPSNPCNILLVLIQDGTGSRTATWPATVKWPASTAPTLTTAAAAIDIIAFYYDGTNYYGESSLAFG